MTPTQVLHMVYLCIIAGIVILGGGGMAWWHHDTILEGEAKCQARTQAAVEQKRIDDAKASQDVIDGLNQDKQNLQSQLDAKPPVVIRTTCGLQHYAGQVPASASPSRAQPGEPAIPSVDSSVSQGSGSGDVGPGVRDLALAGETLAIYRQRLYEWSVMTR